MSCSCRTDRSRFPTQCYRLSKTLRFILDLDTSSSPTLPTCMWNKWWAVQSRDLLACVRSPGQCRQCCHQAFALLAIFFPHSPHGALCLFWQRSRCWRFAQKWFTILRPHIRHGHVLLPVSSYALCFAIKFSSTNTSSMSSGSLGEDMLISCLCLRRTAVMTPFFVSCLAGIALRVMLTRFIRGLNATKAFLWLPRRWSRRCL